MRRLIRTGSSIVVALAAVCGTYQASSQDVFSQAESLIRQAKEQGISYLNSKDDNLKKSAKKNLESAEKLLKESLKRENNCEKCLEQLVTAYFYQSYFGFSKNYDECIKMARLGLDRFPANSQLAYMKAAAHYNSGEHNEAVKAFNRYLVSNPNDQKARELLADSQQRFLSAWYKQADFYNSKESRIERIGQGYQKEVLFQVTPEWELGLGGQAFTQLKQTAPTLQDSEVQGYLEGLIRRLTTPMRGQNNNYTVTILNAPAVNAVTVPGHVFVYSGLLAFVDTESELAGVLAHEMAHNYGHHSARRFIKAYEAQMLAAAIAQAINPKGQIAQLATQLTSQIGINLFLLAYGRHEEKEADFYGAHLMFNAGYNPTALSGFFLKMYKANAKQGVKFLSTHPPDPDRATYLTDYLESFPLDKEMQIDSRTFQQMKARLATLMPGSDRPVPGRGILPPNQ